LLSWFSFLDVYVKAVRDWQPCSLLVDVVWSFYDLYFKQILSVNGLLEIDKLFGAAGSVPRCRFYSLVVFELCLLFLANWRFIVNYCSELAAAAARL